MVIQDAIDAARRLRDTEIPDEIMRDWLDNYDEGLWDRVLCKYMEGTPVNFPYSEQEDWRQIDLLLGDKYARQIYPLYLVMWIDYNHGDTTRYNDDAVMFGSADLAMRQDVSREKQWRPPKPQGWPEDAPWDGRINIRF